MDARGDRNDAPRRRFGGRFVTPTRRAYFGDPITLPGFEGVRVAIIASAPVDPLPYGEFDAPAAGTRYVGFPLDLTNIGTAAYTDALRNTAALITATGQRLEPEVITSPPCDQADADVPPGVRALAAAVLAHQRRGGERRSVAKRAGVGSGRLASTRGRAAAVPVLRETAHWRVGDQSLDQSRPEALKANDAREAGS